MKITLENTDKVIEVRRRDGHGVPARIWQGETDSGVKVHAFITRIAVDDGDNPVATEMFARELEEVAALRPEYGAYNQRYFID